jgi:hypothetical protein
MSNLAAFPAHEDAPAHAEAAVTHSVPAPSTVARPHR